MKRATLQFLLLACFIPWCSLLAQQESVKDSTGMKKHVCRFVYSLGRAEIRLELGNNAEVLTRLDAFIRSTVIDSNMHIRRIRLAGYCSIEGSYALNERLAYNRVDCFRDYLSVKYPELYRYPVDVVWVPEDWGTLSRLVRGSELKEKEEVLGIMRNTQSFDARESLLIKLNGGRAYWYMQRFFFDQLRRVEIEIEYDTNPFGRLYEKVDSLIHNVEKAAEKAVEKAVAKSSGKISGNAENQLKKDSEAQKKDPETLDKVLNATVNRLVEENKKNKKSEKSSEYRVFENGTLNKPLFAIKTNALLLAGVQSDFSYTTPVANIALEYFIIPQWSVELGAMYSYWHYNSKQEFQGISGYRLESRYYLGLPGWMDVYMGLYGRVGDYDLRTLDSSQSKVNRTGEYWDAGLSAGFTFYLGKNWAIEAGARAGYLQTDAISYTPEGKNNWFKSNEPPYHKMRITDLNVSFIYRFR
jgi:hypothetical protein